MTFPRDRQPELMDDPDLPESEHRQALTGLSRLNRAGGVATVLYSRLRRYARCQYPRPLRVLDVASGSGDLPIHWARRAKRDGLSLAITAIDRSDVAVDQMRRHAENAGVRLAALQRDCLSDGLPCGFDVVICSLFMHHLDNAQAGRLLQSMQMAADRAIIVCDLERSRWNLAMVRLASRALSRSPVVHVDALRSVRAAYTRQEFSELAERSLARPVRVERLFPCRFLMTADEPVVPAVAAAFA